MSKWPALQVVIPYGNARAQNHFAYGNKFGDVTLCGRDCYGWSVARQFEGADVDSAYSCQRCVKGL